MSPRPASDRYRWLRRLGVFRLAALSLLLALSTLALLALNAAPAQAQDTSVPTLQSATLLGTKVTLAYDETLDGNSTPAASAFTVKVDQTDDSTDNPVAVSLASSNPVAVSGMEVTLTLASAPTLGATDGNTTVSYTAPSTNPIRDSAGNNAANLSDQAVNWAPVLASGVTSSVSINAPPGTLVNISVEEDNFVDPDGGTLTHTREWSRDDVHIGRSYHTGLEVLFFQPKHDCDLAVIDPPVGNPEVTIATWTATDPDGATAQRSLVYNTSWECRVGAMTVDGSTVTIAYDRNLDTTLTPPASRFNVQKGGSRVTVTNVAVASRAVTLTLAEEVEAGETVTLTFDNTYTAGQDRLTFSGTSLNASSYTTARQVTNVTQPRLMLQSATADGTTLRLNFNEPLDTMSVPPAAAFTITADGSPVQVTDVAISNPVILTLASAVTANQKIRVAYDRAMADTSPLQNQHGIIVPSFGSLPVNQPSVRGSWFTIPFHREVQHYNATLGDDNEYTASPVQGGCTTDFTVTVDGEEWPEPSGPRVGVTNDGETTTWLRTSAYARCDSHSVLLHLGVPGVSGLGIATGQVVSLTYDGPILTDSGAFAGGLKYVDTDTPVPAFTVDVLNQHGTASVNGNILKIEFGVPLDETVVLDPADFEVSRGFDGTVAVVSASISGDTVTLTLAEQILSHEEVHLYFENSAKNKDLGAEPIRTDIRDINGNELIHIPLEQVGPFSVYLPIPVTVLTPDTSPEFERASVPANDRQVLWVAFNEDMDEASSAPGSAFTLTARSPDGATRTIQGAGRAEFVARTLGKLRVQLASAPPADATLTLSYRKPAGAADQITDAAGMALDSFAGKMVSNGMPQVVGVQIVSDPGDDLAYLPGDEIMVRLTFNDAIKMNTTNGTPRLRIDLYYTDLDRTDGRPWHGIGQPDTGERYAAYHGGSGTHTLDFSYTVSGSDRFWPRGVAVVADSLELDGAVFYSSWRSDRVALSHAGLAHDPAHLVKSEGDLPVPSAAMVTNSGTIAINFDEGLDVRSQPAPSAFEVTVNGARGAVSSVTVRGSSVTLTLEVALYPGDTVDRVAYTPPETNPLRDLRHNVAAAFSFDNLTNTARALQWSSRLAVAQMPFDGGRGCHPHDWLRSLPQDRQARCDSQPRSTIPAADRNTTYPGSRLSDDDFTYRGVEYRVTEVMDSHRDGWGGGSFHIELDEAWPEGLRTATMCIGGTALLLSDADFPESQNGHVAYWPTGSSALSAIAKTFRDAADSPTVRVVIDLYESSDDAGCLDDSGAGGQGQQPQTSLSTAAATTVTAVAVSSEAGADDTYALGDVIQVQVSFSEPVKVSGSPQIDIDMDPAAWGTKQATYASGSETTTLTFAFTVVEPNYSSQGIAVLADTLALNGGTIRSVSSGKSAELSHSGLAHDSEHKVNWQATSDTSDTSGGAGGLGGNTTPTVASVAISSDAGSDDTYALGDVIRITVTFSEAVDVTGSPRLSIDMDPAPWGTKWANYESGSGTTTLTFTHTVVQPNYSPQGIAVLANTLELNGGTIESTAADVDANLSHTGLGHDTDHKVNWQQAGGGAGT